MKVICKPIQMVAWFTEDGVPNPVKFKVSSEDGAFMVIKVDKMLYKEKEKIAGNSMIVFTCQSVINNTLRVYEIKYELATCKWILFKM